MVMAVEIGPNRGVGIEIFAAVDIAHNGATSLRNDDGLLLEPVTHLGKRVPDVLMVEFCQRMHDSGTEYRKSDVQSAEGADQLFDFGERMSCAESQTQPGAAAGH